MLQAALILKKPADSSFRKKRKRLIIQTLVSLAALFTLFSLYNLHVQFPRRQFAIYPRLTGYYAYRGALGVHSDYTDGAGDYPRIATSAREAGLDFVVITDPDTMQARLDGLVGNYGGFFLLCGAELDRPEGSLWFLGPQLMPEGLERATSSLIAEVNREGLSVIQTPLDPLDPWNDWSLANFTALEVLSLKSLWRRADPWRWLSAVSVNIFDGPASLARLGVDESIFALWDELCQERPVVGLATVDSTGQTHLIGDWYVETPSYEEAFSAFQTIILLPEQLPDSPNQAARVITDALAAGHCFGAVAPIGDGSGFRFFARTGSDDTLSIMGDSLTLTEPVILTAYCPPAEGVYLRLLRDGREIAVSEGRRLDHPTTIPGVYRVEARVILPNLPFGEVDRLWLFSNPIYLDAPEEVLVNEEEEQN